MKSGPLRSAARSRPWRQFSQRDWQDWRWQFENRIRTLKQLTSVFDDQPTAFQDCRAVLAAYPLSITPYYASLINPSEPDDPIRKQCFPDPQEIFYSTGGTPDPLAEDRHTVTPGLIHRYPDRCLAVMTNTCATYCRHCNRKRIWKGKGKHGNKKDFGRMIAYIAGKPAIREIILSGGDPLTMDDQALDPFLAALRAIPHIEVIRIGSRVPVVMPMRITDELCAMLKRYRPLWLNTQFNHPQEITTESARACERLLESGIPVSNQTVLLRGINDNYEVMRELLYGLQRISVRPYYLFHCDPVQGTDHFRADIWTGMEIMEKLWKNISGLCLPRYVLDVPGGRGKIPLQPCSVLAQEDIGKSSPSVIA